jgi:hypothetical protein
LAFSYRGKLKRSRPDLLMARKEFEALVASDPGDPEAQMALGGWHLGAIIELGPLVARTALGARKAPGLQALSRAVHLGGGRALFPAFAALTQIELNPSDVDTAKRFAETAVRARVASPIDRIMQRQAQKLLQNLNAESGRTAAKAAKLLLPFGQVQ